MQEKYSDLLYASQGKGDYFIWNNQKIHTIFRRKIKSGYSFEVTLEKKPTIITHGFILRVNSGLLLAENGLKAESFINWPYEEANKFEMKFIGKKDSVLNIWNEWKGKSGSIDAWIGCGYGIVIDEKNENEFTFHCSRGDQPEPNFEDLIFTIKFLENTGKSES